RTDSPGDQPGSGRSEGPLRPLRRPRGKKHSVDVETAAPPGTAPNPVTGNPAGKHPARPPSGRPPAHRQRVRSVRLRLPGSAANGGAGPQIGGNRVDPSGNRPLSHPFVG